MVIDVDQMVNASLAGLDQGKQIAILLLPNAVDWDAFVVARYALATNLSKSKAASLYNWGFLPRLRHCDMGDRHAGLRGMGLVASAVNSRRRYSVLGLASGLHNFTSDVSRPAKPSCQCQNAAKREPNR